MKRDYQPIVFEIAQRINAQNDLPRRMDVVVDRVWHHLRHKGVSWVGFYLKALRRDELVLGPHRDKPACSPISMHGACGQAFLSRTPLVVDDVTKLGESYIACDPRDQSELVLPFCDGRSTEQCGVLDLDSFDIAGFDESDVQGLIRVLGVAGLTPLDGQQVLQPAGVTASANAHTRDQFEEAIRSLWRTTVGDPRVCIAVLDGPVDRSHPSLAGADLTCLETLASCEASDGVASQHGTHVTSVIFAQHDKSPIRGVAPGCRGLIVPIFEDTDSNSIRPCSQIDLARAILRAIENGAHVVNISAGQFEPSGEAHPLLADAVRSCADRRVLIVSAVGNDGCECLHVPGALSSVLAVGAMNSRGEPLGFTNWGGPYQNQGILAPGERVLGATPGGGTMEQTGTSSATAVASGIVGLLLSLQLNRGQDPDPFQVRAALLESAIGCDEQPAPDCRRILVGRFNVTGAVTRIEQGMPSMSDSKVEGRVFQQARPNRRRPVSRRSKPRRLS